MDQITFNTKRDKRDKLKKIAKAKMVSMADLIRAEIIKEFQLHGIETGGTPP